MPKYTIRLTGYALMDRNIEVEAETPDDALSIALKKDNEIDNGAVWEFVWMDGDTIFCDEAPELIL